MPGKRCSVLGCRNSWLVTKHWNEMIRYYQISNKQDSVSRLRRSQWIKFTGRGDNWTSHLGACICSIHFKETDYERDLKHELLGLPLRVKLKDTAVPSLYPADRKIRKPRLVSPKNNLQRQKRSRTNSSKPVTSKSDDAIEIVRSDDETKTFTPSEIVETVLTSVLLPERITRSSKTMLEETNLQEKMPKQVELLRKNKNSDYTIEMFLSDDKIKTFTDEKFTPINRSKTFPPHDTTTIFTSNNITDMMHTSTSSPSDCTEMEDFMPNTSNLDNPESKEKIFEVQYKNLLRDHLKLKKVYESFKQSTEQKIKLLTTQLSFYESRYSKFDPNDEFIVVEVV